MYVPLNVTMIIKEGATNLRGSGGIQEELMGYENDVIIVLISEILKNKTITKNKVEKIQTLLWFSRVQGLANELIYLKSTSNP